MALGVDVPGHDADLALIRRDDPGTIGPDEARLRALQRALHRHHVEDRYALGDADDERHLGVDRLQDRVRGEGRRHVDSGCGGASLGHRLGHGIEHRQVEVGGAAASRRDAAHHLGAVGDRLLGMEGALPAGEALADHLGIAVDQDRHQAASLTAVTTFSAASARLSADTMGNPDSARIFLPRRTLVPSRRTTSGTWRLTSRAAATMPSTLGSLRMSLKAVVTRSLVAPPPTSRKFAGSPPQSLMMSMVAMARPAPFTMQPMLPSSFT